MDISFDECLKSLLTVLGINNSQLARAINVDPSLVSRWVSGKRVPSYNSTYVDDISEYLYKNILNSFQKRKINQMLDACNGGLYKSGVSIKNKIKVLLLECQGYSLENKKKIPFDKIKDKTVIKSKIKGVNSNTKIDKQIYFNSRIISEEEIFFILVKMFEDTLKLKQVSDEPILVTLNIFSYFDNSCSLIEEYISKLLDRGWKVVYFVKLSNKFNEVITMMDCIEKFSSNDNFFVYYLKNKEVFLKYVEYLSIPNIGGLVCFIDESLDKLNKAFYLGNLKAVNILSHQFYKIAQDSYPIVKMKYYDKDICKYDLILEQEKKLGSRYLYNQTIDSVTLPINLCQKILKLNIKSNNQRNKILDIHKKRLEIFKFQILYFKYKDIMPKCCIEKMLNKNENKNEVRTIKYRIDSLINALRKYDNYNVALIDDYNYSKFLSRSFMIKGDKCLLLRPRDNVNNKFNLMFEENCIIDIFKNYFVNVWEDIDYINKDKKCVINWLENQSKKFSEML